MTEAALGFLQSLNIDTSLEVQTSEGRINIGTLLDRYNPYSIIGPNNGWLNTNDNPPEFEVQVITSIERNGRNILTFATRVRQDITGHRFVEWSKLSNYTEGDLFTPEQYILIESAQSKG